MFCFEFIFGLDGRASIHTICSLGLGFRSQLRSVVFQLVMWIREAVGLRRTGGIMACDWHVRP